MLAATSMAQETQLLFVREAVRIDAGPADPKAKFPPHAPVRYDVELRGEEALKLEYIHTLNNLADGTGVMIAFSAPTIVALPAMKVYTPVDALFITDDGTVTQILPNVTLGELTQRVAAKEPVKAFLFLKAGEVVARGLRPRDVVAGSMFTPSPAILE
ncbi:MAG: hypothetical protein ACKVOE_08495 [Rickettsiales bacterium]